MMDILSIQIDPPFLRAALIAKSKNKVEIRALTWAPLSNPSNVKALYIPSFKGQMVSGLSGLTLCIRSTELKTGKKRHLEQLLSFQSEASSHFSSEEMLHIPYFSKKGGALLFSVVRENLKSHLEELKGLAFDPDRVSAWSLGLVRYVQWKVPTLSDAFLVDLGSSEWTCVWMEQGELKKSYTLEAGVEHLLAAFWEDQKKFLLLKELEGVAKQTDLSRLKPPDLPIFYKKLLEMRQELAKVLVSFHRIAGARPLIFTGRVDAFLNFREILIEEVREAISAECNSSLPVEELKYAIPLGMALDPSLQLCQKEFFPKKSWKKAGKNALVLFSSSLVASAFLFFAGIKIGQMRKERLLSSMQTALQRWDPEWKMNSDRNPETHLNQWKLAIQKHSGESPYISQAPTVTETLSWLTKHPLLQSFEAENDPLQIREVRYQLVEFPHLGAMKEPYRAKLEIEFQVKSPITARKFHDFLLKKEDWIDADGDISWETLQDGYRTSFFLNNRGPYVP